MLYLCAACKMTQPTICFFSSSRNGWLTSSNSKPPATRLSVGFCAAVLSNALLSQREYQIFGYLINHICSTYLHNHTQCLIHADTPHRMLDGVLLLRHVFEKQTTGLRVSHREPSGWLPLRPQIETASYKRLCLIHYILLHIL